MLSMDGEGALDNDDAALREPVVGMRMQEFYEGLDAFLLDAVRQFLLRILAAPNGTSHRRGLS
jgi:hypothetical protein